MSYAVNFDEKTRRVLSMYELFDMEYPEETLFVDKLPDKPVVDYIVGEDGTLVYDPLPVVTAKPVKLITATPTERICVLENAQRDTDAMTVDQEYRLTMLELGI